MTIVARRECYPAAGTLISVEDAMALVSAEFSAVSEIEVAPLQRLTGRVLARDARAAATSPAYDRSAMDGYACRFDAIESAMPLRCVGRARAGEPFRGVVSAGDCVAIATGAAIPAGADIVVMRERCTVAGNRVGITGPAVRGQNIRRRGEDFEAGDVLLAAGARLAPQHLALLASGGVFEADVRRRVRVAVFSIGDELIAKPTCRGTDHIFDANGPMLLAFCEMLGTDATDLGIVPDHRERIASVLRDTAATHDIIISSAATSKGDTDHVRGAAHDCGGGIIAADVAIKPGKPVAFAEIGGCLHIALPGNPAAALITFLTMGVPLLRQLAGERRRPAPRQMVRAGFSHRMKKGLREYMRVTLRENRDGIVDAQRCVNQGSATLASLTESDGVVLLDGDRAEVAPGDFLPYHSFSAFLA